MTEMEVKKLWGKISKFVHWENFRICPLGKFQNLSIEKISKFVHWESFEICPLRKFQNLSIGKISKFTH